MKKGQIHRRRTEWVTWVEALHVLECEIGCDENGALGVWFGEMLIQLELGGWIKVDSEEGSKRQGTQIILLESGSVEASLVPENLEVLFI